MKKRKPAENEESVILPKFQKVKLSQEQEKVRDLFNSKTITFVEGLWGCLGYGTKVIMFDGTLKEVQDIQVGDQLMGPDSKPRNVLSLCRGREQMYLIHQNRGISYRVNENHILSLKMVTTARYATKTINGRRFRDKNKILSEKKIQVENISVIDYLDKPSWYKVKTQGYIPEKIDFPKKYLEIDPYYLGLWLADGSTNNIRAITNIDNEIIDYLKTLDKDVRLINGSNVTYLLNDQDLELNKKFKKIYNLTNVSKIGEKYIPDDYIYGSYEDRMNLIAGFLDGDGYFCPNGKFYEFTIKLEKLANQLNYILRSLGFRTNFRPKISKMKRSDGTIYLCKTYRVSFSVDKYIPCKIKRKQYQNDRICYKNPLHTEISIEKDTIDDYYGFTLDGDNLFLLEDFTVTHNTGKTLVCCYLALEALKSGEFSRIVVTRPFIADKGLGALPGSIAEKLVFEMQPIIDNFYEIQGKDITDKMIADDIIRLQYNGKMKGITVQDAVLIVDETADLDFLQFREILTRLGTRSKMLLTVSKDQIHKSIGDTSCYYDILCLKNSNLVGWIELKKNHRNPLMDAILDYIENNKDN